MQLSLSEKALIRSYRQLGRLDRQLVWRIVKAGMKQMGRRIKFTA